MPFDDYEILGEQGHGHEQVEYRARHRRSDVVVALQIQPSAWHGNQLNPLVPRLEALALLEHPSILPILDAGPCERGGYLVRPLVEGESLDDRLRDGPLEPAQAVEWASQLADATVYAHEHGIFGMDLVPNAIRVGANDTAILMTLDTAYVRFLHPPIPRDPMSGIIHGIAACMPPEHVRGQDTPDDPRRDVWAFGTLLYHLLTGQRLYPFLGALDILRAILDEDIPRPRSVNPAVPAALEAITLGCLKKNLKDRYSNMELVADLLQAYREGSYLAAPSSSLMGRVGRWMRGWWESEAPVPSKARP